mgnify:CR=1 FL=1
MYVSVSAVPQPLLRIARMAMVWLLLSSLALGQAVASNLLLTADTAATMATAPNDTPAPDPEPPLPVDKPAESGSHPDDSDPPSSPLLHAAAAAPQRTHRPVSAQRQHVPDPFPGRYQANAPPAG